MRNLALLSFLVSVCIRGSVGTSLAQITPGETIPITDHAGVQTNPDISGEIVVWSDDRSGTPEIYGHDLRTGEEFAIATGGPPKSLPEIEGQIVTWFEGQPRTLRGVDLATMERFTVEEGIRTLSGNQYIALEGRSIYYPVESSGRYAIHRYDIDTDNRRIISPDGGPDQTNPDAHDGRVIWSRFSEVWLYDPQGEQRSRVTIDGHNPGPPVIAGDRLFYVTSQELWTHDLGTDMSASFPFPRAAHPSADGSIVVWIDFSSVPARRIQGMDVRTGEVFDVVERDPPLGILQTQQTMEYDRGRVVWTETDTDFLEMHIRVTRLITPRNRPFRRGDADSSGEVDTMDAIRTANVLFLGEGEIGCADAADSNDDGGLDVSDAIMTLRVLFLGPGPLPPPGTRACGSDPTRDALDCAVHAPCQ